MWGSGAVVTHVFLFRPMHQKMMPAPMMMIPPTAPPIAPPKIAPVLECELVPLLELPLVAVGVVSEDKSCHIVSKQIAQRARKEERRSPARQSW